MCVLRKMVRHMGVLIMCDSGAQCCAMSHKHAQGCALQILCMRHQQAARLSAHLSSQCGPGATPKGVDTGCMHAQSALGAHR